jgi:hypothetical protein
LAGWTENSLKEKPVSYLVMFCLPVVEIQASNKSLLQGQKEESERKESELLLRILENL